MINTIKKWLSKFKIPTLLGITIILIGIVAGVILTLKEQVFISKAAPDVTAQNITLSNISDTSVSISWQTASPTISSVTYGQINPNEQTALNDKDSLAGKPANHSIHYVTIKNLLPKTNYQYRIISGKTLSEIGKFTTSIPISQQVTFSPIIGSVLDSGKPLEDGVAYLYIANATVLSAQIKSGNFLIPLSEIRKADLSESFPLSEDATGKITIISDKGITNALFRLKDSNNPLPPIKLGRDIDLTIQATPTPASASTQELSIYDLNRDGKINAADYAILLQNLGKKGKDIKNDLNKDSVIDQKDLDLMIKKINQ